MTCFFFTIELKSRRIIIKLKMNFGDVFEMGNQEKNEYTAVSLVLNKKHISLQGLDILVHDFNLMEIVIDASN